MCTLKQAASNWMEANKENSYLSGGDFLSELYSGVKDKEIGDGKRFISEKHFCEWIKGAADLHIELLELMGE
jgi:hypothetical protein